ncbi:MAG: sulfite exporter TauE/SafE family protein [SAR324 cluster bacterium]|nr:sulfite exporter TauE/SafE family protein [SAR324 cluster bacterium]
MFEIFSQLTTLLGLGFFLGLQHAFDPDHLVAVSTLVSKSKSLKKSSLLGLMWGLGHTTTLFAVGAVLLFFKWSIPNRWALSFEFIIGILLVFLGGNVLRRLHKEKVHLHKHVHEDGLEHIHLHSHQNATFHDHKHTSFLVGLLHGLAGSAALSLLALSTADSLVQGFSFILIFGLGSMVGMFASSTLIAIPFKLMGNFEVFSQGLKTFVGVSSVILGFFLMSKIGYLLMSAEI